MRHAQDSSLTFLILSIAVRHKSSCYLAVQHVFHNRAMQLCQSCRFDLYSHRSWGKLPRRDDTVGMNMQTILSKNETFVDVNTLFSQSCRFDLYSCRSCRKLPHRVGTARWTCIHPILSKNETFVAVNKLFCNNSHLNVSKKVISDGKVAATVDVQLPHGTCSTILMRRCISHDDSKTAKTDTYAGSVFQWRIPLRWYSLCSIERLKGTFLSN